MLSLLIFIPLIALLPIFFLRSGKSKYFKFIALGAMGFEFIISGLLYIKFSSAPDLLINGVAGNFRLIEKADWINLDLGSMGKISIDYFLGVDGLNIFMIMLSAFVLLIGVISSWNIEKNTKGYFSLYLLLSSSIMGCFMALDFFLFFLFFELMLLPMYFLIGLWGGPRREYASIKFFLYTLTGSLLILIVMIALYLSVIDPVETALNLGFINNTKIVSQGMISQVQSMLQSGHVSDADKVHTFNILYMMDPANYIPGSILHTLSTSLIFGVKARYLAFLAIFIGFAIKMPSVPFHTWLPDAHVEAPTPVSVVLAALLLKVGAYGIIRIAYPVFPDGAIHYAKWIALLGVISIIYGAFNALAMKDIKKLIAYSSVSHMGFVLLGIASLTVEGINGAIYQMFSHGILTTMLFLIAGVIYDRTHDRTIDNYRGLASRMPNYAIVVTVAFFASLGLPGFSGFIAELFVLLGAFHSYNINGFIPRWLAVFAVSGILIGAAYYLWTLQKMFFGKFWIRDPKYYVNLKDLDKRELIMLVPLIIATVIFGLFPGLLFNLVSPAVSDLVSFMMKINPHR
jgi:NADH-quinone oxidoreductase subunit M